VKSNIMVGGKLASEIEVIVVGNAGSLLEQNLGSQIDEFEYILRMGNSAKFATQFSQHAGEKVHGLLVNIRTKRWRLLGYDKGFNGDIEWDGYIRRPLHPTKEGLDLFYKTSGPTGMFIRDKPQICQVGENAYYLPRCKWPDQDHIHLRNRYPSSGYVAVIMFMRSFKHVTICGFDGFHTAHWYPKNKWDIGNRHPGRVEIETYKQLEKDGSISILGKIEGDWEDTVRPEASHKANKIRK